MTTVWRAALRFLILVPTSLPAQVFECRGEEPFWHLKGNDVSAVLSRPGPKETARQTYQGQFQRLASVKPQWHVWRSTPASGQEQVVLTMRKEACHSTMAEGPAMPYRGVLSLGAGEAAMGCCQLRSVLNVSSAPPANFAVKPPSDWAKILPDLLSAVRKCTIDGGISVSSVGKAWPLNNGMVGVRLVDVAGQRHDCITDTAGKSVDRVQPVEQGGPPLPGEGNPIFLPAREQPPRVACGRLERVDANGAVYGWLHYDPCR